MSRNFHLVLGNWSGSLRGKLWSVESFVEHLNLHNPFWVGFEFDGGFSGTAASVDWLTGPGDFNSITPSIISCPQLIYFDYWAAGILNWMQSVVVGDDSGVEESGDHKCRAAAEHIPHQDWSTSLDKGKQNAVHTVNRVKLFNGVFVPARLALG